MGRPAGSKNKPKQTTATKAKVEKEVVVEEKEELTTEEVIEEAEETVEQVDEEKEALKRKTEEQDKMIKEQAEMFKQMQEQLAQLQAQATVQPVTPNIVLEQNKDMTRTVKVTSLVGNVLTLSTMKNGNKSGRTHRFDKYGQTKNILFTDMQAILLYHTKQFESGKVILSNEQDYNDLGLSYISESSNLQEKIDEIVALKEDGAIDAILDMDESMQERIIDLIAKNLADGVNCDYNKIKALKREGIDIEAIVEQIENRKDKDEEE